MLVSIIIYLIVFGLILYLVQQFLPIDPKLKNLIQIIIVIIMIFWLLRGAGFLSGASFPRY